MFAADETVRVLDGAFAGFVGRVFSVDAVAGNAVVNVRIFGRATPVEVAVDALELTEGIDLPTPHPSSQDPTAILDEE